MIQSLPVMRSSTNWGWDVRHPMAAWLGPTKLARAILFATITNIVAYLPFLMITGDTGEFLYSLPIVMTCALVASRIVSMTFIPQLGYYLMRPGKPLPPIEYRRTHGVTGFTTSSAITHSNIAKRSSHARFFFSRAAF